MIDKDDIKDILIYFEEADYSITVSDISVWGLNTNVDVPTPVGVFVDVVISRKRPKSVLSFDQWNWINTTIKTALSRMNQEGIEKQVQLDCNRIVIRLKEKLIVLKNINSLVKIIKEFNAKQLGGIVLPAYDQKSNSIKIRLYKQSNKDLEPMFNELSKNFNIQDLRQNGVIMNRFGLPSGDQISGLIANLEPKNLEIYE